MSSALTTPSSQLSTALQSTPLGSLIGGGGSIAGSLVRRTVLTILIQGQDLSSLFPPIEHVSLRYEDMISFQTDNLELICPDIGDQVLNNPLVKRGNSLRVKIDCFNTDYIGSHTQIDTGEFDIDQIRSTGPPSQIHLLGTSVPLGSHLKLTLQHQVIFGTSLRDLGAKIAAENNLDFKWDVGSDPNGMRDKLVEQLDEHGETELQALSRLCKEQALDMKITADRHGSFQGTLIIFDPQAYELKPPVYVVDFQKPAAIKLLHWVLDSRSQDIYSRATFNFMNVDDGQVSPVTTAFPDTAQNSGSGESLNSYEFPIWSQPRVPTVDV